MALNGGEGEETDGGTWDREWQKEVDGWEALEAGWARDMGPAGGVDGDAMGDALQEDDDA